MNGFDVPSGKLSFTMSMYERTSFTASSMFVPHSSSRVTTEMLSFEREVISFSPSTEFKLFSNTLVMLVSISVALAPGYVHITITYGGSISGIWSIGSFIYENAPMIITAIKISIVVTGLLMAVL